MNDVRFNDLVMAIRGEQAPRVWSLLITVFGDLAQDEDARISGPVLGQLTERIGLKPEAVRVALHRLRKDGWLTSQRQGRSSDYFLTDWGRAQSRAASPVIYGKTAPARQAWMILTDPGKPMEEPGAHGVPVAPNMFLSSRPQTTASACCLALDPAMPLPGWMTAKVCDARTTDASVAFLGQLTALDKGLDTGADLSDPQTAALRVLIVHGWRRIVLKAPDLPAFVFPPEWQGPACRDLVTNLLHRLPVASRL